MGSLRSDGWFFGDDEVTVLHRVSLRSAGVAKGSFGNQPVIGIANSASDLNPCNLPLRDLVASVKEGIRRSGGTLFRLDAG